MLIGPAAALDRLLSLGKIELRPWLERQCSEVDKVTDVAEVEARKERVLRLLEEAKGRVDEFAGEVSALEQLIREVPEEEGTETFKSYLEQAHRSSLVKAQNEMLAAKDAQDHIAGNATSYTEMP